MKSLARSQLENGRAQAETKLLDSRLVPQLRVGLPPTFSPPCLMLRALCIFSIHLLPWEGRSRSRGSLRRISVECSHHSPISFQSPGSLLVLPCTQHEAQRTHTRSSWPKPCPCGADTGTERGSQKLCLRGNNAQSPSLSLALSVFLSISLALPPPISPSYFHIERSQYASPCLALGMKHVTHHFAHLVLMVRVGGHIYEQTMPSGMASAGLGRDLELCRNTEEGLLTQPGLGGGDPGRFPGESES